MSLYTYSTGDLWSEPNTYMYTPYHGEEFLNDYQSSRQDALRYFSEVCNTKKQKVRQLSATEELLQSVLETKDRKKLQVILGKIERLKKLAEGYTSDFRKKQGSYRVYSVYALAGRCIASFIRSASDLRELNALLKLNDVLIAHKAECQCPLDAKYCLLSIEAELEHIKSLRSRIE